MMEILKALLFWEQDYFNNFRSFFVILAMQRVDAIQNTKCLFEAGQVVVFGLKTKLIVDLVPRIEKTT